MAVTSSKIYHLLSSRELIEHFTNHFNPPLTKADEIPHELTTDISGFVNQLQELSCQYLFRNEISTPYEVINSFIIQAAKTKKAS